MAFAYTGLNIKFETVKISNKVKIFDFIQPPYLLISGAVRDLNIT
jgi:hypothetical protein